MIRRLAVVSIGALVCFGSLRAQPLRDSSVLNAFRRAVPEAAQAAVWQRHAVSTGLDLVIVLGTPKDWPLETPIRDSESWGRARNLGLLLQEHGDSGKVYLLTTAGGTEDCFAHVVRATATDTVISCDGEKSERYPNHKFVYDIRAKRLVSRFAYGPFGGFTVGRTRDRAVRFIGYPDDAPVDVEYSPAAVPPFRLLARHRSAADDGTVLPMFSGPPDVPLSPAFGPGARFRLIDVKEPPSASLDEGCGADHRVVVERGASGERQFRIPEYECDRIGPWQIDGNRFWFGKTFYAGEGRTGLGGFGVFDTESRQYRFWSPAELQEWSISAIHVQSDAIWLALVAHGEYGSGGGGVMRYDRTTGALRRFGIGRSIGTGFAAVGEQLFVTTDFGIVLIVDNGVKGLFVDRTTDGRLRLAEGLR